MEDQELPASVAILGWVFILCGLSAAVLGIRLHANPTSGTVFAFCVSIAFLAIIATCRATAITLATKLPAILQVAAWVIAILAFSMVVGLFAMATFGHWIIWAWPLPS